MLSSGFSQSQRTKLTKAGFKSVSEVLQTNPVQLAKGKNDTFSFFFSISYQFRLNIKYAYIRVESFFRRSL